MTGECGSLGWMGFCDGRGRGNWGEGRKRRGGARGGIRGRVGQGATGGGRGERLEGDAVWCWDGNDNNEAEVSMNPTAKGRHHEDAPPPPICCRRRRYYR